MRVACVQVNAGSDWKKNLTGIHKKMRAAVRSGVKLIVFPETFYWRGKSRDTDAIALHVTPVVVRELKTFARVNRVSILLGSILEASSQKNKSYNTSILISDSGREVCRYRKIHLFDIALKKMKVRESDHVVPGKKVVTGRIGKTGAGLTVCYDLRFPELFRELTERGAKIIFVPANFTYTTGVAHWETLLRARAIENQVFIVAPGQVGIHPGTGIKSFGTSLIIDPWGAVLARGSREREEILIADLDLKFQERLRSSFPVLKHRRLGR